MNGRLTGYAGGLKQKEWLLSQEGALSKLTEASQPTTQLSISASSHDSSPPGLALGHTIVSQHSLFEIAVWPGHHDKQFEFVLQYLAHSDRTKSIQST